VDSTPHTSLKSILILSGFCRSEHTEALVDASRMVGLEADTEKTNYTHVSPPKYRKNINIY